MKERNVTWASDYSLLFLDNPVGAGFSFTDDDRGYPNNEDDVSTIIIIDVILNTFFEEWLRLQSNFNKKHILRD